MPFSAVCPVGAFGHRDEARTLEPASCLDQLGTSESVAVLVSSLRSPPAERNQHIRSSSWRVVVSLKRQAIVTDLVAQLLHVGRAETEQSPRRWTGPRRLRGLWLPLPNQGLDG